jgi:hypothetical protein
VAGRKPIFTPEMQALILKNFRQTGNLKNSAIRAGMSERSFFRWMGRCQNARSGPLWHFQQEVERLRADRVALLAVRHHQGAFGCILEVPRYDQFNNLVCDQNGRPVTVRKFLPPNLRAIWRELALHDPETYGPQKKATVPECPPPSQHARPRDLMPMLYSVVQSLKARGLDPTPSLGPSLQIALGAMAAEEAKSAEEASSADTATSVDTVASADVVAPADTPTSA